MGCQISKRGNSQLPENPQLKNQDQNGLETKSTQRYKNASTPELKVGQNGSIDKDISQDITNPSFNTTPTNGLTKANHSIFRINNQNGDSDPSNGARKSSNSCEQPENSQENKKMGQQPFNLVQSISKAAQQKAELEKITERRPSKESDYSSMLSNKLSVLDVVNKISESTTPRDTREKEVQDGGNQPAKAEVPKRFTPKPLNRNSKSERIMIQHKVLENIPLFPETPKAGNQSSDSKKSPMFPNPKSNSVIQVKSKFTTNLIEIMKKEEKEKLIPERQESENTSYSPPKRTETPEEIFEARKNKRRITQQSLQQNFRAQLDPQKFIKMSLEKQQESESKQKQMEQQQPSMFPNTFKQNLLGPQTIKSPDTLSSQGDQPSINIGANIGAGNDKKEALISPILKNGNDTGTKKDFLNSIQTIELTKRGSFMDFDKTQVSSRVLDNGKLTVHEASTETGGSKKVIILKSGKFPGSEIMKTEGDQSSFIDKTNDSISPLQIKKNQLLAQQGQSDSGEAPKTPLKKKIMVRSNTKGLDFTNPNLQKALKKQGSIMLIPSSPTNLSHVVETSRIEKSIDEEGIKLLNQYKIIKPLGQGASGKVKLAIDKNTNIQYAVKIINKNRLKTKSKSMKGENLMDQLKSEIAIMKKLDHPNIVKLHEVIDDEEYHKIYLIMDFVRRGAILSDHFWEFETMQDKQLPKYCLDEKRAKKYFTELILGLDYLHNYANIVHRDLKPENLLIAEDDVLKISDFGISRMIDGDNAAEIKNKAGTKLFMAPEIWCGKSFKAKPTDVWAAGATLYFFITGNPPFRSKNQNELRQKIEKEQVVFDPDYEWSEGVKDVITKCLDKNPETRITIRDLMEHPWLTNNGQEPLDNVYGEEEFWIVEEDDMPPAFVNSIVIDQ